MFCHTTAENNVGYFYRWGYGVPADYAESAKWFRQSAAGGNSFGLYNLGMAYRDGIGVEKDDARSQQLLGLAADAGNADAAALYVRPSQDQSATQSNNTSGNGTPYVKSKCSCCMGLGYSLVYMSDTYQAYDKFGTKQGTPMHYVHITCSCCHGTGVR